MAFPQAFRRFIATALTLPLLGGLSPAWAGEDYKLKIDRFDGTKTATFDSSSEECKIIAGQQSRIAFCYFIHSTESSAYPIASISTHSKNWQLLNYRSKDEVNVIITYLDSSVARKIVPISMTSDVGRGYVLETVKLHLRPMKDELENISQMEVQVGHHEYLWKPDPVLIKKVLNFEEP